MSFIQTKSGEQIAVGKILCVGANYLDHIAEMNPGKTPAAPSEPVIFMKPSSAIVRTGGVIVRPDVPGEMHHEVELIAVISKRAKNFSEKEAAGYVLGYGVGLDLTLRDLQAESAKVSSLDVVEINPILDEGNRTAELAVDLIASLLGQRIL